MIEEHDLVALTADLPADGLLAGDVGVVVSVHRSGAAYTIEFMNVGGDTVALRTLEAAQVRRIAPTEMTQARPLATAA